MAFLNLLYWGIITSFSPGISPINNLIDGSLVGITLFSILTFLVYVSSDNGFSNNPISLYIDHVIYFIVIIFWVNVLWLNPQVLSEGSRSYYLGASLGTLCGLFWRLVAHIDERIRTTARFLFVGAFILMLNLLFSYLIALNQQTSNPIFSSYREFTELLVMGFIVFAFIVLRPDDWLLGFFRCEVSPTSNGHWKIPHVTTIHFPRVLLALEDQLKKKWQDGLRNIKAVVRYSYQRPYIIQLVKRLLEETPSDKIMERVLALYNDDDYHDTLFRFVPRKYDQIGKFKSDILSLFSDYERHRIRQEAKKQREWWVKFDTKQAVHEVIAGLWYLEKGYIINANVTFSKVVDVKDSEELKSIIETWNAILNEADIISNAPLKLPKRQEKPKFVEVWDLFSSFKELVRCMWVFRRCHHPGRRNSIQTDALDHVKKIKDMIKTIQQKYRLMENVSQRLDDKIIDEWAKELRSGNPESLRKIEKIDNPYIFSEPLRANLPAKRASEIDSIKKAWTIGNFQPVLIYGQRHIGKTSLILSLMAQQDNLAEVVYVNVSQLAEQSSQRQLLWSICKEVEWKTKYPSPFYDDLIRNPYYIFRRYMQEICDHMGPAGIIIVLDQLDHLDKLSSFPTTNENTLRFLWELSQTESKLCFVFVTVDTPKEIAAKYSNPFVTGSKPIQIGYMNESEVKSILRNPNPDFLPYFDDQAIEKIFKLTNGHPYLVQVLAYCLIDRVSSALKDRNHTADPLFTDKDIENNEPNVSERGIVYSSEFSRLLEHYSSRVRTEISIHEKLIGDLLRILASAADGIREDTLKTYKPALVDQKNIRTLVDHQIITAEPKDKYTSKHLKYQVELFRKATMYKIREALTDEDKLKFQTSFSDIYPQIKKEDFGKDPSQIDYIMVDDDEKILARCSIWPKVGSDDISVEPGFIGHYAAENHFVGSQLLDHACDQLWQYGSTKAFGPVHGSIYKPHGLRATRGSEPANRPSFHQEPTDPIGSRLAWSDSKFNPIRHYNSRLVTLSVDNSFITNSIEQSLKRQKYTFRTVNMQDLEDEIKLLDSLARRCLYDTELKISIHHDEFLSQFEMAKKYLDPDIVIFAQHGNEIMGFIFALPNRQQTMNGKEPDAVVIQITAVLNKYRGKGIEKYLMLHCLESARVKGYKQAIHAMVPEKESTNAPEETVIYKVSKEIFDQHLRRYTLYERTLKAP